MAPERDWLAWHAAYDDPASALSIRLKAVVDYLGAALDSSPQGEIALISLCAGQGRDVVEACRNHPRRGDVVARLVELDPRNTEVALRLVAGAGLGGIEIVTGDASSSDTYAGMAPAHVVVACGIFGNLSDDDVERFIGLLPMLCRSGATVLWTRHRRQPDLTGKVRGWFAEGGFEEVGFTAPGQTPYVGVGAHRWSGPDGELEAGVRLFEFRPDPKPAPWETASG